MKQETFRSDGLIWFFLILVTVSFGILSFNVTSVSARPVPDGEFLESHHMEPSPEPLDPQSDLDPASRPYLYFVATAYSVNGMTASGVPANTGIVAADPEVLPIGSVIEVTAGRHTGIYTVLDTGPAVRGREIDIYISNTAAAQEFGRRKVRIRVLRLGWNASSANSPIREDTLS